VTQHGEMVYDFDSPHKKPYETLILGRCTSPNVNNKEGTVTRHHKDGISCSVSDVSSTRNSLVTTEDTGNSPISTEDILNSLVANRESGKCTYAHIDLGVSNCAQRTKYDLFEKSKMLNEKTMLSGVDRETAESSDPGDMRLEGGHSASRAGTDPALPDRKLIISVPCSIHSKKPPLSGRYSV
jgi:hypothetical protein